MEKINQEREVGKVELAVSSEIAKEGLAKNECLGFYQEWVPGMWSQSHQGHQAEWGGEDTVCVSGEKGYSLGTGLYPRGWFGAVEWHDMSLSGYQEDQGGTAREIQQATKAWVVREQKGPGPGSPHRESQWLTDKLNIGYEK